MNVAVVLPLAYLDAWAYRWHRADWIKRACLLGLGIVAAEHAGIFVGDMNGQFRELIKLRQRSRAKAINDRWRALERDAIARFGHEVDIFLRLPLIESTARCRKSVARQVMEGDVWGVAVDCPHEQPTPTTARADTPQGV